MNKNVTKDNLEIEYKIDELLNEIAEKLNFAYVSDIRIAENREEILMCLEELDIETKDNELYDHVMMYING